MRAVGGEQKDRVSKHEDHKSSLLDESFPVFAKESGNPTGYPTFAREAMKTNVLMWGSFMSSSLKAAIHRGPNYLANLEVYKNTNFEDIQSLVKITQKLLLEHSEEILNVNTIDSASLPWTRSVLSHDQVIQWTKAKERVYSDSVPCLGKMNDSRDANTRWESQVEEFKMSASHRELLVIDGEAIEFEWNILPGFSSLQILQKNPE